MAIVKIITDTDDLQFVKVRPEYPFLQRIYIQRNYRTERASTRLENGSIGSAETKWYMNHFSYYNATSSTRFIIQ